MFLLSLIELFLLIAPFFLTNLEKRSLMMTGSRSSRSSFSSLGMLPLTLLLFAPPFYSSGAS